MCILSRPHKISVLLLLPTFASANACMGPPPEKYPSCFPSTSENAALVLNRMYMAYNEKDDKSLLGPTIWMGFGDISREMWCSQVTGKYSCGAGHPADCRMSASVYNHKMMIKHNSKITNWAFRRTFGAVFNQHLIEGPVGKCAFTFDGATDARYNCGCGGGGCTCTNGCYEGYCDDKHGNCTADSHKVVESMCQTPDQPQGKHKDPQKNMHGRQCFYNLPALGWPKLNGPNHLREMVNDRMKYQHGLEMGDHGTPKIEEWNEVVLDLRELMPRMHKDAEGTVWAFIFADVHEHSAAHAKVHRDNYCEKYKCKTKVPLVAFHPHEDFSKNCGPFHASDVDGEQHEKCSHSSIHATRTAEDRLEYV